MRVSGSMYKTYGAMLTGCSELGLVLMAVMTKTKSHEDMEIPLQSIATRNSETLETLVTDNPSGDQAMLKRVIEPIIKPRKLQVLGDVWHGMAYFAKAVR